MPLSQPLRSSEAPFLELSTGGGKHQRAVPLAGESRHSVLGILYFVNDEYGSSSDRFSWILWFSEKLGRLPDTVFIVFSARVLHNSHFPGFRSGPKRTATKSYADSWWYHLGECLLWLFQAHLRFWFFGHFCRPLPFAYRNSGSLVFTKFGHQP